MHKILFVCHGNICRSPMAEFVMKDIVYQNKLGDKYIIESAAATNDAVGMTMDLRAKRELDKHHVSYTTHIARKMTREDYQSYDYLVCMDEENFLDMNQITGGDPEQKEYKLLAFTGSHKDVDDPWYTGDFDTTYKEIRQGCEALFNQIESKKEEE